MRTKKKFQQKFFFLSGTAFTFVYISIESAIKSGFLVTFSFNFLFSLSLQGTEVCYLSHRTERIRMMNSYIVINPETDHFGVVRPKNINILRVRPQIKDIFNFIG